MARDDQECSILLLNDGLTNKIMNYKQELN